MRIAFITPRYAPFTGGVEVHVNEIARRLVELGHSVDVLTQAGPIDLPEIETVEGVVVRRFKTRIRTPHYAMAPSLFTYLKANVDKYDIVHGHNYHSVVSMAALYAHVPNFVFTPHFHGGSASPFRNNLHKVYKLAGSRLVARSRSIICVSHAEAALLLQQFDIAANRLTVIPNGVDVASLAAAEPFTKAKPVVLSVGRLEDYKRVDRLITAMKNLPELELIVIGDGPHRPKLEELITASEVSDNVSLLGRVSTEELHRWYRTASVYVTLSTHEAYGMTLLEGMVSGAAAVASDIPAHAELISLLGAKRAALVSPDMDTDELATLIRDFTIGEAGVEMDWVHTWDDVTAKTLACYDIALGDPAVELAS